MSYILYPDYHSQEGLGQTLFKVSISMKLISVFILKKIYKDRNKLIIMILDLRYEIREKMNTQECKIDITLRFFI